MDAYTSNETVVMHGLMCKWLLNIVSLWEQYFLIFMLGTQHTIIVQQTYPLSQLFLIFIIVSVGMFVVQL